MPGDMRSVFVARYWARMALRAAMVVIALWALIASRPIFVAQVDRMLPQGPEVLSPMRSLVLMLAGFGPALVLLIVGERWMVRWWLPDVKAECSGCGYPSPPKPGPCPECGLDTRN